ncbi:MAG TPA: phosphoglycerate mutase [Rhodanobacteraceae bacterium]|nr:phosphoglycerate mutase [Rhodanobacteraceae bacterium]
MSILHVLLPPLQTGNEPGLQRWLARGDRLLGVPDPRDAAVRGLFRFAGAEIPAAALRHRMHADDAGAGSWVCADPAYVRSEATGARLMAWPLADVSDEEARELAVTLKPLFGDAGAPLTVDTPSAWCLHQAGPTPRVEFAHPAVALGVNLLECLPEGNAGRRWRHLFNEAQVALHAHPVNDARAAAGKLPVNALWFWGAGPLPESVETVLTVVASGDDVIRGLAKAAQVACVDPSPEAADASTGDVLLDLDVRGQTGVSPGWLAHFQRWLRKRRFDAIEVALAGGERFRVRHAHRLRFWRRG